MDSFALVGLVIAAVGYGSYYIPVKRFEIFDGVVYQWYMCIGILIGGVAGALFRNDWNSLEITSVGFYVPREGLLSGFLWMVANVLATLSVKYIGMGNYYLIHEITNLGATYFIGVFGPQVGIPAKTPSIVWLASLGFACELVGMVPIALMKQEGAHTASMACTEDACANLQDFSAMTATLADCVGSCPDDAQLQQLSAEAHDHGQSFGSALPILPESMPQMLLPTSRAKWLRGAMLALLCGCILALQYVPLIPWQHRLQEAGHKVTGLEYVFSTCLGIFLSSTAWLLLAGSWKKIRQEKLKKPVLRPALFAGVIWGISCYCQLYAMSAVPYAIGYSLIVGGGLTVSLFWSIFVFGEAKSTHNRKCVTLTFFGVFTGIIMLGLAA